VLREGLRLIEQREAENAAKIAALRDAIRVADEDVAQGRVKYFERVEDLEAHLNALADAVLGQVKQR
jgi:antitoxin ParD1/3/4